MTTPDKPSPLRAAAEAQLAATPEATPARPVADLLHELQVHQIELEMQNEALRQTQQAFEQQRDRYLDLYEFAPVGYLTLSAEGVIEEVNLTGVTLLGRARKALLQYRFVTCVAPADRDVWLRHFLSVRQHAAPLSVELALQRGDGSVFQAQLDYAPCKVATGGTAVRVAFADISERQRVDEALGLSERFLRNTLDGLSAQIAVLDDQGAIILTNQAYRDFAAQNGGEPRTVSEGANYLAVCDSASGEHAEEANPFAKGLREVLSGAQPYFELAYPCHSPVENRWFIARVTPFGDDGPRRVIVAHENITERKLAEDELRIAAVAFSTQSGMAVTDPNGVILRVNPAFERLTGYSADEAVGQSMALLHSGRHGLLFYQHMWQALHTAGQWKGEIWNRRKSGQIYAEMLSIAAIVAPGRGVTHYVANFSDITAEKESEAEIHRLAYYDPLTNLPNRRLLQDRLGQALATTARTGLFGALFFIDIDHFKRLNDTRGHDTGDQLLVEVAQRLRAVVRECDTVARQGGDEFVVLMESLGASPQDAAALAGHLGEKLRAAFDLPFMLKGDEYPCQLSIGVGLFQVGETVEELFKHADLALYQAKNAGRNQLRFFDPTMQAELDQRSALEAELRKALECQQFRLYYQLQVDAEGCPIGVEALLRWQHPERGLVLPDTFIPLAEDTGLILPIGLWVLETACAQLAVWATHAMTCELKIAVNVSARQFRSEDFVAQVQQVLTASGASAARLKLELTESMVLEDVASTIEKMTAIKGLGVSFAMDDFGTGYSSLAYLAQLPLDLLKIDKSFVHNLPGNRKDETMARTIISMGRGLDMDVIAEGVETEAQSCFLAKHGCHAFQGYLFCRPLPIEELDALLLRAAGQPCAAAS